MTTVIDLTWDQYNLVVKKKKRKVTTTFYVALLPVQSDFQILQDW